MHTTLVTFGVVFGLVLLAGCLRGDECEVGTGYCEGNDAFICQPPCSEFGCRARFEQERCWSRVCVEDGDTALCALWSTKDPECGGDARRHCDGTRVTWCNRGFASSSTDCADTGKTCAPLDGDAICALSSEPDARCEGGSPYAYTYACDGLQRLTCRTDFVVREETCDLACALHRGRVECALMDGLDPLCAADAPANDGRTHCASERIFRCSEGLSVFVADCGAHGGICVEKATQFARCEFPLPVDQVAEARGEDPGMNGPVRELSASEPDPRCPQGELFGSVCDGQKWLGCRRGRATRERECAYACVEVFGGTDQHAAWCKLADGSDERCGPEQVEATRSTLRCAGDVQFFCSEGRALEEYDCRESGERCVPALEGYSAYCSGVE